MVAMSGTEVETDSADTADVRRQRRRLERRDRVYTSALTLFVEQGYDGTTMDDIAARAGVARASVFNYFARKSAFLDDWAARRRKRAFGRVPDAAAPLRDRVAALMSALAEVSEDTRDETVAVFGSAVRELNLLDHPALADEVTALIEHADPGEIAEGIDPSLVGLIIATGYFAVMNDWSKPGRPPFDLGDRLRQMAFVVTDGFTVPTRGGSAPR